MLSCVHYCIDVVAVVVVVVVEINSIQFNKSSFLHAVGNFIVVFYFSHDCFVFPLSFSIQLLP